MEYGNTLLIGCRIPIAQRQGQAAAPNVTPDDSSQLSRLSRSSNRLEALVLTALQP